eukprot:TRINITY_DN31168_c0_g1_i1.p1 TRINITY_DN31168_c0_g1~~TRINITY_DN31168_c0_g1_i1.p1  ORF type:complete len:198 (+),score=56.81 TRINITY_DN31168_c0_g1_i1:117-710(+)
MNLLVVVLVSICFSGVSGVVPWVGRAETLALLLDSNHCQSCYACLAGLNLPVANYCSYLNVFVGMNFTQTSDMLLSLGECSQRCPIYWVFIRPLDVPVDKRDCNYLFVLRNSSETCRPTQFVTQSFNAVPSPPQQCVFNSCVTAASKYPRADGISSGCFLQGLGDGAWATRHPVGVGYNVGSASNILGFYVGDWGSC